MQEALSSAQSLIGSLQDTLQSVRQENKLLRQKIALLIKRYFGGQKSEAIDPAQLELLLAELSTGAEKVASPKVQAESRRSRKKAVRKPLPGHLPVERVVIEPQEVIEHPGLWRKIGEEITEELDWKPAQFLKRLYIRPKYVKRTPPKSAEGADSVGRAIEDIYGAEGSEVVIGAMPSRLIEKGLPGAGLLAQVVISKYEDHLPLYRQEKIYWERYGVKIARASLGEWVEQVAQWLKPIYEVMKSSLLKGSYLQADETPIRYLDPDLPGKSQTGYLWAYSRPKGEVIFEWQTSRGREGPAEFLKGYQGLLQADGYGVYRSLAKERKELVLLGCMAHARRKFHQALEEDKRAAWIIRQIGHLYSLEKRLRTDGAGPALREAYRRSQARPVLDRIERALRIIQPKVLPKSLMGTAIAYALEQWSFLCRYVEHGQAEIDNNLVENAIRPTAIGKKNFLFIGHPKAGWRSAVIYSVLGSCRRLGIDPHEYLNDVLRRLPDMKITQIATITPEAWARTHKSRRTVS